MLSASDIESIYQERKNQEWKRRKAGLASVVVTLSKTLVRKGRQPLQALKSYGIGFLALMLLLIATGIFYRNLHPKTLPENLVMGVGRFDGDLVRLNAKYLGRVIEQRAEEGKHMKKGELVTLLDSTEEGAKLQQLEAQVMVKEKELAAKRIELSIASRTIPLSLRKTRATLEACEAGLVGVEKELAAQRSVVAQERRDYERIRNLYDKRLIQKEALEKAKLKLNVDSIKIEALHQKRKEALTAVDAARADLEKAKAQQQKIYALEEGVTAFEEGVKAMKAAQKVVEEILAHMRLVSPVDGYVIEKIAEVGEVVGAGMPVATLLDPRTLYLKIFVDTLKNGKIKLGDKAVIFLDAWPDKPIPAEVVRIAQKAEFTPKEVSVRSDRIQRVYAVHLKPLEPDPLLKLGLPATGVVSLDGRGLPHSLNELPEQ